jgi:hypothetical protein
MRTMLTGLAIVTIALANTARADTSKCLKYTPEVTTLTGTLLTRKFYGPPNYGEDPKTDELDTFYFLKLTQPICTSAEGHENDDSPNAESEINVSKIQLYLYEATKTKYPKDRDLLKAVGQKFTMTGTLGHAAYAHDHTPVIMDVKSMVPAK